MPKTLIAGNWKMNGLGTSLEEITALKEKCARLDAGKSPDILICPPATLVASVSAALHFTTIDTGGQDCHSAASGAHTGDISAEMLKDAGAAMVIVGHSERRADHGEDDATVRTKAEAALRAGLIPIVCVGETREEREAGRALDVVKGQLKGSLPEGQYIVAYEPVWAIGTGLVPTNDDIAEIHAMIREETGADMRILYGGSVKPGNAAEILGIANVNGALVGGASLKAEDFFGIIEAAPAD